MGAMLVDGAIGNTEGTPLNFNLIHATTTRAEAASLQQDDGKTNMQTTIQQTKSQIRRDHGVLSLNLYTIDTL